MTDRTEQELCDQLSRTHLSRNHVNHVNINPRDPDGDVVMGESHHQSNVGDTDGDVVMGQSHKDYGICYEEKPSDQILSVSCCNQDICFDCLRRLNETNEPSCPFCRHEMGTFLRENGFGNHRNHQTNGNRTIRFRAVRRNHRVRWEDDDSDYALAVFLQEQEYTRPSQRQHTPTDRRNRRHTPTDRPRRRNTQRTNDDDPRKSTCGYCGVKVIDVPRHQQRNQRCIELQHRYHHR